MESALSNIASTRDSYILSGVSTQSSHSRGGLTYVLSGWAAISICLQSYQRHQETYNLDSQHQHRPGRTEESAYRLHMAAQAEVSGDHSESGTGRHTSWQQSALSYTYTGLLLGGSHSPHHRSVTGRVKRAVSPSTRIHWRVKIAVMSYRVN